MLLEKHNVLDILPLLPAQEGMLYQSLIKTNNNEHFEQIVITFSGKLQDEIFKKTWDCIINNNESLRSVFRWEGLKKPVQIVLKKVKPDIRHFKNSHTQELINTIIEDDRKESFNFEDVPFRVTCIDKSENEFVLIITNHHILFDGWSLFILIQEFLKNYKNLLNNEDVIFGDKKKLKNCVENILSVLNKDTNRYWEKYLTSLDTKQNYILNQSKDNVRETRTLKYSNDNLKVELELYSKQQKTSVASILYSLWGIVLNKFNYSSEIFFDITHSIRPSNQESENVVGLFINTLPFKVEFTQFKKFSELLNKVQTDLAKHQVEKFLLPIEKEKLSSKCNYGENTRSLFVIENYPIGYENIEKLSKIKILNVEYKPSTNYDLTVITSYYNSFDFQITFNSAVFDEEIINNLLNYYIFSLKNVISGDYKNVTDLNYHNAHFVKVNELNNYFTKQFNCKNDMFYLVQDKNGNVLPLGFAGEIVVNELDRDCDHNSIPNIKECSNNLKTNIIGRINGYNNFEFISFISDIKIGNQSIDIKKLKNSVLSIKNVNNSEIIPYVDTEGQIGIAVFYTGENTKHLNEEISFKIKQYNNIFSIVHLNELPLVLDKQYFSRILFKNIIEFNDISYKFDVTASLIIGIWSNILDISKEVISLNDNFFKLGGNSLKIPILISRINQELNINIPISSIYEFPELSDFIELVKSYSEKEDYQLINSERKEYYQISPFQKGFFFLQKTKYNDTSLNMTHVIEISGKSDLIAIRLVFNELIRRHISLRTSFRLVNDQVVQLINDDVKIDINIEQKHENEIEKYLEEFTRAFDIEKAPLFRSTVIELLDIPNKWLLLIDIHHIISDGYSLNLLLEEFLALYHNRKIFFPKYQYIDYSESFNRYLKSDSFKIKKDFWENIVNNIRNVTKIPEDSKSDKIEFRSYKIKFNEHLINEINEFVKKEKTSLLIFLLSVLNILVHRITGDRKIIIGSPVSGRGNIGTNNILGLLMNTVLYVNDINEGMSFGNLIKIIKTNVIRVLNNQDFPFAFINKNYNSLNSENLFNISLNLQEINNYSDESSQTRVISNEYLFLRRSKVPIAFNFVKYEEDLDFFIDFNSALYSDSTIKKISDDFISIIRTCINDPKKDISEIDIKSLNQETNGKVRYNCILIGNSTLPIKCAEILLESGISISAVFTKDQRVIEWCEQKAIVTEKLNSNNIKKVIKNISFDFLFSIDNPIILDEEIISSPLKGAINYHDSELPKYAGINATAWAVMNREEQHAISWHVIEKGIDTGDIIDQISFPIEKNETTMSLNARCYESAIVSFKSVVKNIINNEIKYKKQNLTERTYYGRNDKLINLALLSGKETVDFADSLVRGLNFGEYDNSLGVSKICISNCFYIIDQVDFKFSQSNLNAGQIIELNKTQMRISLKGGEMCLYKLKSLEGNVITIENLILKHNLKVGAKINNLKSDEYFLLNHQLKAFVGNEKFWIRNILNEEYLQIPSYLLKKSTLNWKNEIKEKEIKLNFINDYSFSVSKGELSLVFLLSYLANLESKEDLNVQVGIYDDYELAEFRELFNSFIPLNLKYDLSKDLNQIITYTKETTEKYKQNKLFLKDIFFRYPDLKEITKNWYSNENLRIYLIKDFRNYQHKISGKLEFLFENESGNGKLMYDSSVDEIKLESFLNHFQSYVNALTEYNISLSEAPLICNAEKQIIDNIYNNTTKEFNFKESIVSLFEKQVFEKENNIAAIFDDEFITYKELSLKSNKIGSFLSNSLTNKKYLIPVIIDHSIDLLITILGIVKAGFAYVPIDVKWPDNRKKEILEELGETIVIAKEINYKTVICNNQNIALFDELMESPHIQFTPKLINNEDLIYAIYTSGSTGKPKGVMIQHKGVLNRLYWMNDVFGEENAQAVLQTTRYIYDSSVWQFLWPLINGGKTIITSPKLQLISDNVIDIIWKYRITLTDFVPSVFQFIVEGIDKDYVIKKKMSFLRYIILGGEEINEDVTYKFMDLFPDIKVINLYGPTEATIGCIYHIVNNTNRINIPIGKPISNMNAYVLDKYLRYMPIGAKGELCLGGIGISSGYINNSKKNNEVFIIKSKNPYQKIYKTGDVGRFLPDGDIDYLGRIDNQVKIRGYRIELGEIELCLMRYFAIDKAIVNVVTDKNNNKHLCAFILKNQEIDNSNIKEFISKNLPSHLVPSVIHEVKSFKLLSSGKVDRKALPTINISQNIEIVESRTAQEEKILEIWSIILKLDKKFISVNNSFFEIGGSSLSAISLISKFQKEFKIKLELSQIFIDNTICKQAKLIGKDNIGTISVIKNIEKKEYYELSASQLRMYFLQKVNPKSIVYNVFNTIKIEEDISHKKLENILKFLINRHESLRTSIINVSDKPFQKNHEFVEFVVLEKVIKKEDIEKVKKDFIRPFDLREVPLFRICLLRVENSEDLLLIDIHHIISDWVSLSLLGREFLELVKNNVLAPLRIQYKDFSEWINSKKEQSRINEQEKYWLKKFSGNLPVLNFPTDYLRPSNQGLNGATVHFILEKEDTSILKNYAKLHDTTLHIVMMGIYNIFLSKMSGQKDIVIGIPIALRNYTDTENVVGMFVNTLVIRSIIEDEDSLNSYIERLKLNTLKDYENQEYPFEELVGRIVSTRDSSRNPIFDVVFRIFDQTEYSQDLSEIDRESLIHQSGGSKFDLTLGVVDYGDELLFSFEYCTDLFKPTSIERYIGYIKRIISQIPDKQEKLLFELEFLTEEEKKYLLNDLNQIEEVSYPKEKTVHQLFEEQVEKTPHKIALELADKQLSYTELNKCSNQLAERLIQKGVQQEDIIAVYLGRSIEVIIGILGVLKAGACYLPIDTIYPIGRINGILKDSQTKFVISKDEYFQSITTKGRLIDISEKTTSIGEISNHNLAVNSNQIAYIIYTSGSTGKPKGVMIEHRNLISLLKNNKFQFDFKDTDIWCMLHSHGFDFSVWEMYGAFFYGGRLIIISLEIIIDTPQFYSLLIKNNVTILNQTPAAFNNIIEEDKERGVKNLCLRYIIFGGDLLNVGKLKYWKEKYKEVQLINMYGITETTIHVTYKLIEDEDIVSGISNIGCPIPTLKTYIMNDKFQIQPVNVLGEIYVGGKGLSRGYLNNNNLTREKFIKNPYNQNELLYKSGDIGRLNCNGEIEYIGRKDNQVQLRGFRIELGEIESLLQLHENISESIVLSKNDNGHQYLCAYIVSNQEVKKGELRSYLSVNLPDYMIPSSFVAIEKIPLTDNGKIDRKSLLALGDLKEDEYIAPTNDIEKKLCKIWSDVLNIDKKELSVTANFFEIGGNSIILLRLNKLINSKFKIDMPLMELFRYTTIRAITEYVSSAKSLVIKKEIIEETDDSETMEQTLLIMKELQDGE